MSFFVCLFNPDALGTSERMRQPYESLPRNKRLEFVWHSFGSASVLIAGGDPHNSPKIATHRGWVAVGEARLDNRSDLEYWAACECQELTDLEVILRVVARHGMQYVPRFLGDFGFVVFGESTRALMAACDAFAVKRVYYAERDGIIALASRAEALALHEEYDPEYLTRLVALQGPSHHLSVYAGVRQITAASMSVLSGRSLRLEQYWSVADFEVDHGWAKAEREVVERCRQLLAESVRLRLDKNGGTWAQLSGGLDSSSVVSLAQWLAKRDESTLGLAGAVTYVDRQNTGADERAYSDAVAARWNVPNELVIEPPTWQDSQYGSPNDDQPTFHFHSYPRDRQVCEIVRAGGGRVLLTGWGGDELFIGNMFFFADWVVQGHVWLAAREMARYAAIGRASFWELAYRNAVLPLLPRSARNRLVHDGACVPPWLNQVTLRRYQLGARSPMASEYAGPAGRKYSYAISRRIATLPGLTGDSVMNQTLDVRHPFMYRPLVEFALRLPPSLRARPHSHRWVLREAMRGILPEVVRTRIGKQDTGEAIAWSLASQREQLASLVQDPVLGSLGVIDAGKFREAFDVALQATHRRTCLHAQLMSTLAVEAWLQARSGRWPRGGRQSSAKHKYDHQPS